jgi:hypothetical protein
MLMTINHYHDFNPFSPDALSSVETIAVLPHSNAFEHVMYDNKINRTSTYEYAHKDDDTEDTNPLIIDVKVMENYFPTNLKGIFPDLEYVIEQLQIVQSETTESEKTSMSFFANGTRHSASIENGTAFYRTFNQYLEPVEYEIDPDNVTALIASMLYAKQYDPTETVKRPIALADPFILTERNPRIALTEQLIVTLGDFCGNSEVVTQSMFDSPTSEPIVATLISREYPDKSSVENILTLNELTVLNDYLASVETTMIQNVVNVEDATSPVAAGKHSEIYAEQRSITLSDHGIQFPVTEIISSKTHYDRWAKTCVSFMSSIKTQMINYKYLDD